MRIVAIALAAAVCTGCGGESVLRVNVVGDGGAAPASLRVTIVGADVHAAPRTIAPVTLPGVVVAHWSSAAASTVCVQVEALDGGGNVTDGGAVTVGVAPHKTTTATVQLTNPPVGCSPVGEDMAVAQDLAGAGGGGGGGAGGGGGDMAVPPDMTTVAICPAGALFCDDFESGTLARWTQASVKYQDMGTIAPSMAHAAHGVWSVEAQGSGTTAQNYIEVEKDFSPGLTPPVAMRANVWLATPLDSFTMVFALYDDTFHGFSLGGDTSTPPVWVMTEDQTMTGQPDRKNNVPTPGPGWHCVEVVIDAAGMVTAYVDNAVVAGPFMRYSAVAYTSFFFGIDRTVRAATDVFVDDVAIGPARLYCPP